MVCTHSRKPKISDFEVFEDGYIFFCSAKTESECLQKRLFGTILAGWADVRKINRRTAIFLYALGRNPVVHGIFVARSPPFLSYRMCEEVPVQVRTNVFHKFDSLPGHLLNFAELGSTFHTRRLVSSREIWKQELAGKYLTKKQTLGIIKTFMKHTRAESPPSPPSPISVRAIYKSRSTQKPPIRRGKAVKGHNERNVKRQNLFKLVKEVDSRRSVSQANGLIRGLQTVVQAKRNGLIMGPHRPSPGKPKGLIMGPHDPFKEVLAPVHSKNKKRKKHRKKEQSSEMAFTLKGRPSNHLQTKGRRHKINSTNSAEKQGTRKHFQGKSKKKGHGQPGQARQGATIRIMSRSTTKKNGKSGSSGNSKTSGNSGSNRSNGSIRPTGNTRPVIGSVRLSENTIASISSRPNGNSRPNGSIGPGNNRLNVNTGGNNRASGNSRLNVNTVPRNNRLNENSESGTIRPNRPRGDYDLCWEFNSGGCRRPQCAWRHEMSANPNYKPPKWVKKSWEKRTNQLSNKWRGRNKYLSLDK